MKHKDSLSKRVAMMDALSALDLDLARRRQESKAAPGRMVELYGIVPTKKQEWIPKSLCYCYSHIHCLFCNRETEISQGWRVESESRLSKATRYTIATSSAIETLPRRVHFLGTEQVQICPHCAVEQVEKK